MHENFYIKQERKVKLSLTVGDLPCFGPFKENTVETLSKFPWFIRFHFFSTGCKLALHSGILALGIGDTMASVVGKTLGRYRWPSK